MRLFTAAMFALAALLTLFLTTTASPYGDAMGPISRAKNALQDAEQALASMQKHIALLDASDVARRATGL